MRQNCQFDQDILTVEHYHGHIHPAAQGRQYAHFSQGGPDLLSSTAGPGNPAHHVSRLGISFRTCLKPSDVSLHKLPRRKHRIEQADTAARPDLSQDNFIHGRNTPDCSTTQPNSEPRCRQEKKRLHLGGSLLPHHPRDFTRGGDSGMSSYDIKTPAETLEEPRLVSRLLQLWNISRLRLSPPTEADPSGHLQSLDKAAGEPRNGHK